LQEEIKKLENLHNPPISLLEILRNEVNRNEEKLSKEVRFMQTLMETIYDKWEDIKKIRDHNRFISTPYNLKVKHKKNITQQLI
jgi:hypothetical protein